MMANTTNPKVFHFKAMQSALADFKSLLNDESMADVVFSVGNDKIKAHRQIVGARCEVLKTMLYGTFAGEGKEIDVGRDVQPEMFRRILEFIYGGAVQIDEKNALSLMELAHKYSITNLEEACSSFLGKTLDVDNVLPILTVALHLQRKDLSDVCVNFIRARAKDVFSAPSFLEVSEDLLCSILADDELAMDELDIFEAALRWGKKRSESNNEGLETVMAAVVQVIRFPLIGASKLINRVKPTGVVPIELYVEALEFSASPRTVPMEGARFRKRKQPKITAGSTTTSTTTTTSSTPTRDETEPSPARSRPSTTTSSLISPQLNHHDDSDHSKQNNNSGARRSTQRQRPAAEELEEDSKLDKTNSDSNHTPISSKTNNHQESTPNGSSSSKKQRDVEQQQQQQQQQTPTGTDGVQQQAAPSKRKSKAAQQSQTPVQIPSNAQELKFERDFDENGLFYWIATNGKMTEWENPATSGKVLVTSSASFDWGSASNLLARKNFNTWTASQPGVWVSFSLRGLSVLPTHYSLRHGYVSDGANLRNWVFEGSSDGQSWVVLSTHNNDRSLGGNYGTASWKIENANDFFQHFRIRSTGRDGGNSDRIQLAGIELYGLLQQGTA